MLSNVEFNKTGAHECSKYNAGVTPRKLNKIGPHLGLPRLLVQNKLGKSFAARVCGIPKCILQLAVSFIIIYYNIIML